MSNHEIKKNFNEELRQLTVNDSVHADTFNPLFEQLINNDATLKETIEQDKTELLSEIETVNTQLADTESKVTEIINIYSLGAKPNTDITSLLENALALYRHVYIPNGTFNFSSGLVIRPNCTLELEKGAILNYTANNGDCIRLTRMSTVKGGFIQVPTGFSGSVIVSNSLDDRLHIDELLPFQNNKNDTLTHLKRYIKNVEIQKFGSNGFNRPSTPSEVSGTAIALSANGSSTISGYSSAWGIEIDGARIQGAFEYGVTVEKRIVENQTSDPWIHDVHIKNTFAQYAQTFIKGVNAHNLIVDGCNFQPAEASDGQKYIKNGVLLVDSDNVKIKNTTIWDWQVVDNTNGTNTMVRLEGICNGLQCHTILTPVEFHNVGISYEKEVSILSAKLYGAKGEIVLPKFVFYKNNRAANSEYNSKHLAGFDSPNFVNRILPVEYSNPNQMPNAVYRLGYFYFTNHSETSSVNDELSVNSLTMTERNNRVEFAKSHLYFVTSNFTQLTNATYYSELLCEEYAGAIPLYYYKYNPSTRKLEVFKLIRTSEGIASGFNNYVDIKNARFFYSDFSFIGTTSTLDMSEFTILQPSGVTNAWNRPLVAGHCKFSTKLGKPIWVKTSATFNADGTILNDAVYVDSSGTTVTANAAFSI